MAALEQVLRSGGITAGPKKQQLEEHFANYVDCRHAVARSSATGAIHVTLLTVGIDPGDEVITLSRTWRYTTR
jgi:UDP-4-amino-4-deoxy-L-arabinose-oxoglutarate aminotransferase